MIIKHNKLIFCFFLIVTVLGFSLTHSNVSANLALGKSYKTSDKPNYVLSASPSDLTALTDGEYTVGHFWTSKKTIGWQYKRPIIITIDLEKIEPIRGVSYNTAAGVADVTWPISIHILVSDDGVHYFAVGDLVAESNKRKSPPTKGYAVHRYWIDTLRTHGRYVQLVIDSGGPYCFVDEIEIYRGEDYWVAQQQIVKPSSGGIDFFKKNALNNAIKSRLYTDLQDTMAEIKSSKLKGKEIASLLAELNNIEVSIVEMPEVNRKSFQAIFPINTLQARIFSVRSKIKILKGQRSIETWISHPLDYIMPTQGADSASKKQIDVAMMRGEWRSAAFNITNAQQFPIQVQFSVNGLPGGNNPDYLSVYEVQWTDTVRQIPIAEALIKITATKSGYSTIVPAGVTRQIWLTFHPMKIAAGNYFGRVIVESKEERRDIPLNMRLFPFVFPNNPRLHLGGFDYTDSDKVGSVTIANRDKLITHLQERLVDSPWATSLVMPFGSFSLHGELVQAPDTSRFDSWITHWANARRYFIFLAVGDMLSGSKIGSEKFNMKVKSWINFWIRHVADKGIKPEQIVLLLVDEPHEIDQDKIIVAWAKAIHAAQPKVTLWEDPTYVNPRKALPDMLSSIDILCFNREQLINEGKQFEQFYRKQKADGKRLEIYSCSGPMHLRDPYAYVRLQAWTCWDLGAEGTAFWSFSDTGGENPWNAYEMLGANYNYAPMFLAPDSVTPGKHMEAMRESVEDYEYFVMLEDAIAHAKVENPNLSKAKYLLKSGARRVLEAENANKLNWTDNKNRWIAEEVRLEILEMLVALGYSNHN